MVGRGTNKKSIAYVGNLVEFLDFGLGFEKGYHIFNYADKPDLTTNELIRIARNTLGRNGNSDIHIPYFIGLFVGYIFDLLAFITGRSFSVSSIRIKKFCADTTVSSKSISQTELHPPYSLEEALRRTISYEFPVH